MSLKIDFIIYLFTDIEDKNSLRGGRTNIFLTIFSCPICRNEPWQIPSISRKNSVTLSEISVKFKIFQRKQACL